MREAATEMSRLVELHPDERASELEQAIARDKARAGLLQLQRRIQAAASFMGAELIDQP